MNFLSVPVNSTNDISTNVAGRFFANFAAQTSQAFIVPDYTNTLFDLSFVDCVKFDLTNNITLSPPVNGLPYKQYTVHITQRGAYTVTWGSGFTFIGGSAPIITATADKTDSFDFIYNGTTWYVKPTYVSVQTPYSIVSTGTDASTLTGIDKTGATDSASGIQTALTTHTSLYFPAGTYKVGSPIKLNDNNVINGAGPTATIFNYTGALNSGGADTGIFYTLKSANGITINNTIRNVQGYGTTEGVYLLSAVNTNGVTVSYCNTILAALISVDNGGAANVSNTNVDHCNCLGNVTAASFSRGVPAVHTYFANGVYVKYSNFNGFYGAWVGWGGDSNPANGYAGSAPGVQRACRNMYMDYCTGKNQGNGPAALFFGSLCDNVNITNSICYDSTDVGIDFEGCTNSIASGNIVYDCVNGALSTFYNVDQVQFVGNTCYASTRTTTSAPGTGCIFVIYGNAASEYNIGRVYVTNNQFFGTASNMGRLYCSGGVSASGITITNNTMTNCTIDFCYNFNSNDRIGYQNTVNISNNTLSYTRSIAADAYSKNAISVANAIYYNSTNPTVTISNNTITSTVTQTVDAIRLEQAETDVAHIAYLNYNVYTNFANQVRAVWGGTNTGVTGQTLITGNTGNLQVTRDETSYVLESTVSTQASNHNQIIKVNGVTQP